MAINTKAEEKEGTEQNIIRQFVDLIRPQIKEINPNLNITTQARLPYTNFCWQIDENGNGVDFVKGKNYYAVDVLIYWDEGDGLRVPLVVMEGKIKGYSTHDVITYSEKARTHKNVFPHLQYGFIVLDADDEKFMPVRYHLHSTFDFEGIFPTNEDENQHNERISAFVEVLKEQITIAQNKWNLFFLNNHN